MSPHCPICGHPFTPLDLLLAEHDANYQCHHCWSRVQAGASKSFPALAGSETKFHKRTPAAKPRGKTVRHAA